MKLRLYFTGMLCGILLLLSSSIFAGGGDDQIIWRPATPEELQMKTPKVEADADAEAIFWEVRMDDKKESVLSYEHYVRVKIFSERGREKFAKFDIPFTKGKTIQDVAARVIKPDGTIINLDPKDVYEREIVKAGKIKVLTKSFAVPGIEPGVIVEYQYKEVYKDSWGNGVRFVFQRDIPKKISDLRIGMAFDKTKNTLSYRRNFYFGAGENLVFPASAYDAIKNLFDEFFKANTHIVTLKQIQ
jgi:hypothetical protein